MDAVGGVSSEHFGSDSAVGRAGARRGVDALTEEEWRGLLQRFVEDRRASDDRFGNAAAVSGSIDVHEDDARLVRNAFDSEGGLGRELARLLKVVLRGPELGWDVKTHYARIFRGMVHVHLSQGGYMLGRSSDGGVLEPAGEDEGALGLCGGEKKEAPKE